MRQHRSLFCLFARHSFWQVLLTLAVCGVVQWLVFLFQLRQADSLYGALLQCTAFFSVILFLGFGVVSAVLLFATTGWASTSRRTPWPGCPCPRAGCWPGRGFTTPWSTCSSGGSRPWCWWGCAGFTAGRGAFWGITPCT